MTAALVVAIVAGAALLAFSSMVYAFLRHSAALNRQHARERDLLINQLLHATDRPWVEAPAARAENEHDAEERRRAADELARRRDQRIVEPSQHLA